MGKQGPGGLRRHNKGQEALLQVIFAEAITDIGGSAIAESSGKHLAGGGDLVQEDAQVGNRKVVMVTECVGQEGERRVTEMILWSRGSEKGARVDQKESG